MQEIEKCFKRVVPKTIQQTEPDNDPGIKQSVEYEENLVSLTSVQNVKSAK